MPIQPEHYDPCLFCHDKKWHCWLYGCKRKVKYDTWMEMMENKRNGNYEFDECDKQ